MRDYLEPRKIVRLALTAAVFAAFGLMFLPFWKPLLMAALFGFALVDVVDRFSEKKRRGLPALAILTAFSLILTLPILFVLLRVARSVTSLRAENLAQTSLYQSIEQVVANWQTTIDAVLEKLHVSPEQLPQPLTLLTKAAGWLVDQTTVIVANLPELVLALFAFSVALYYFLTEARTIRKFFIGTRILDRDELDDIIVIVKKCSYRTLVASALIGAIQASVVALGAIIFGYQEFMLVFIITFFVSFIPVIGAAPVAVVLALLSLANGAIGSAIGLLVIAAIAGSVDNLLKPYLVSSANESPVHPILALLAIIGAVIVYGIPGLLLGPILMELAVRIIPVFFHREPPPEPVDGKDQALPIAGP